MTRRFFAGVAAALAAELVFVLAGFVPALAEHTRFWRQSDYENFERGTPRGTAVRSDGRIMLAPKVAPLADTGLAYLWALHLDSRGNLYAAGGSNAKVVRVDTAAKTTTVFESTELSAQALAVDRRDNLYVGTSPDGKIYKVTPDGRQSVFFDPQMKYIWDLAMGADGTLYVATGDTGTIFSVSPDGKGDLFYASSETHVRALALDGRGNLLAGTEPSGLVLRIPLAGPPAAAARGTAAQGAAAGAPNSRQAYVLYETPRREITALVTDPSGNLYVGAIGEKSRAPRTIPQAQQQAAAAAAAAAVAAAQAAAAQGAAANPAAQQQQLQAAAFQPFPAVTSSAVYRIASDGSPEELWTSRDDLVYALGVAADGKLLLGTGNQGVVIQLDGNRVFSRLARSNTGQITGLARAANGKLYVATANPGKVFTLGPELEAEGSFESQPFDARIFSRWGRLTWWGENGAAPSSGIELYVRAGNTSDPENNWSAWAGPYRDARGEEVQAPAARFVQWKAVLRSGAGPAPEIAWVNLAYLPKNVPPRIDAIAVQDAGIRAAAPGGGGQAQSASARLRQPASTTPGAAAQERVQTQAAANSRPEPPPQGFAQKGQQAVLWTADDDNEDELTYSVYYRGESEKDWKLLRDEITQSFYSWDTTSMPDGAYYLKIAASDEPANAPGEALTSERESDRFVVDNTPPEILGIAAEPLNAPGTLGITVRFRASDATSAIVSAQYSLDAGDWTLLLPAGGVSDSLEEPYAVTLRDLAPGEHTLALRAYDQYENLGAGKVTFTVPAARR